MKNKEIAIRVGTTEQVVKNYLRKVYDKLGVADRLELALYCLNHHVVDGIKPPPLPARGNGSTRHCGATGAAQSAPAAGATIPARRLNHRLRNCASYQQNFVNFLVWSAAICVLYHLPTPHLR